MPDNDLIKFRSHIDYAGLAAFGGSLFFGWPARAYFCTHYRDPANGTSLVFRTRFSREVCEGLAARINRAFGPSCHVEHRDGAWCVVRDDDYFDPTPLSPWAPGRRGRPQARW